jgi:hypothetical protein
LWTEIPKEMLDSQVCDENQQNEKVMAATCAGCPLIYPSSIHPRPHMNNSWAGTRNDTAVALSNSGLA